MENTKENRYTVIKNSDLLESLTETERQMFNLLVNKITSDRTSRRYYVVNVDEPYAHKVLETILDGEENKQGDYVDRVTKLLAKGLKKEPIGFKSSEHATRIQFNFNSYPLVGNLESEIQPAIGKVLRDIQALEIEEYDWCLFDIERFRDTFSFQDAYIGEIFIYEKSSKE